MLALRRKTSNAITTMATVVAIVVLIRNCHQRADLKNTEIINAGSSPKQQDFSSTSTGTYPNKTKRYFYNQWQQKSNNSQASKHISSKMAYALLQEIKKLNPRQKATFLGQFNITEAQTSIPTILIHHSGLKRSDCNPGSTNSF